MKLRGHSIETINGEWVFSDTKEPTIEAWKSRPCGYCGLNSTPEGHDGCLGTLPNVMNACCGHGEAKAAYIQYSDGMIVRSYEALERMLTMTDRLEMKNLIEVAKRETVIAKGLSSERESVSLPIDIVLQIIQQAERVQELEKELQLTEKSLEGFDKAYEKEKQQNKRYREVIKKAKEELDAVERYELEVLEALEIINEALEDDE